MNKYFVILLVLILVSTQVFSVVVSEPNVPTNPNAIEGTTIGVEIRSNVESLRQEVRLLPTEENMLKFLNNQVTIQSQLLEEHRSTMMISQIIINLCFLVLGATGYFYLKSKGRV